jgi:hypothetical protein
MFGSRLNVEGRGSFKTVTEKSGSYELHLDSLPESVAEEIEAVTFTPPPEFGPTSY